MLWKLAWRNLWRNRVRTWLSALVIAIGLVALIFIDTMMVGMTTNMVKNATDSLMGHAQMHALGFRDEYDVKLLTERLSSIIKANIYYPECELDIPEFDMNYPDSVVVFTMENGQVYQDLLDPDSLNNEQEWSGNEELKKIEWKYYPNPTRDFVTVESPEEIEYIYLTDLSGKILQRVDFNNSHKITLYLGDYPTGIYLLRYPIGKQWVSGKVILVR